MTMRALVLSLVPLLVGFAATVDAQELMSAETEDALQDLLQYGGEPMVPGAILAHMGLPPKTMSLVFYNTKLSVEAAEEFVRQDCASYGLTLSDLTHKTPAPESPDLSTLTYKCL
jgi:hypothetical protein